MFGEGISAHEVLLAFSKLPKLANQNGDNHIELIRKVLRMYDKTDANLEYIVADNTNLNPSIAAKLRLPFLVNRK
jgi:hypothetical protein